MSDEDDDIWTNFRPGGGATDARPYYVIDRSGPLIPASAAQDGKATAFELIADALFGDPDKPFCYALIDPGLAFGLEEFLSISDSGHRDLHRTPRPGR